MFTNYKQIKQAIRAAVEQYSKWWYSQGKEINMAKKKKAKTKKKKKKNKKKKKKR